MPAANVSVETDRSASRRRFSRLVVLVAGFAMGVGAMGSSVSAQNALGDGRALDGGLSTQGRYNSERPDYAAEYQFRNAIVTGNAGGGRSFRGDVGYTASGSFRGSLGSNDLYNFRRDSLLSGLAGRGIRGTEALQYQMQLSTGRGGETGNGLSGGFFVAPSGSHASGGNRSVLGGRFGGLQGDGGVVRTSDPVLDDELAGRSFTLRSPSAYQSTRGFRESLLDVYPDPLSRTQLHLLTASPLGGVRLQSREVSLDEEDTTPSNAVNTQLANDPLNARVDFDQNTAHGRLMHSFGPRTEQDGRTGFSTSMPIAGLDSQSGNDESTGPKTWFERLVELRESLTEGEAGSEGEGTGEIDPETIELLRGNGQRVERFVYDSGNVPDAYIETMKVAEKLLAVGRYFEAEEQFIRAVSLRPGDVSAQAGRVHSQIGAGLYLSCAINLRDLLIKQPEMMSLRYEANLLPSLTRLKSVKAHLSERVEDESGSGTQMHQAAALILAYVGQHTDDDAATGLGLEKLAAYPEDKRLAEVLQSVWLNAKVERDEAQAGEGEEAQDGGAAEGDAAE